MKHVFIIGSRGLPAQYGGFETFVEELVSHKKSSEIIYHVSCLSDTTHHDHFIYKGADCFTIKAPKLGPARVIAYDMMAINYACSYVEKNQIKKPVFYILGNTIGAFIRPFVTRIHHLGGQLFVNPDGLEWKRSKWSKPVQAYLKYSEKCMAKYSDKIIADNEGIEQYINENYPKSKTKFIAYGTELSPSSLTEASDVVQDFFDKWRLTAKDYYLVVGRFIPENNYEAVIKQFMASHTSKKLVIICNHEGNPYFETLKSLTHFEEDERVQFVGTVYHRELLTYLREQAFAYIHGHEVGGTNPGLLEAMAHTDLNLVYDVSFNKSVARSSVYYWQKDNASLTQFINELDTEKDFADFGQNAKAIIKEDYTWEKIVATYEELFLNES